MQLYKIVIQTNSVWYHGSNKVFAELKINSTITQWGELAETFLHQPSRFGYDDNGEISHNGTAKRIFIHY